MQPSTGAKGLTQWGALSFAQELRNEPNSCLWILLHDPVARVRHNTGRHVAGNKPQILRHPQAERLLRAEGEYRHLQFAACCKQCLVVDGVLPERTKLLERIVHRMRPCIKLR